MKEQEAFNNKRTDCPSLKDSSTSLVLLLVTLPMALALARTSSLVGLVFVAFLFLAYHTRCLKAFAWILGIAVFINACILSGFAVYTDADYYLSPLIRIVSATQPLTLDGFYPAAHLCLPQGFVAWGATLYRLTGWVDAANSLPFILIPAAWITLRQDLTRLQTLLLIGSPLTFVSFFCTMPDGSLFLLLLIALFALRQERFWLTLLSAAIAATFKTSAWIPCALIVLALFAQFPKRWWQIGLIGSAVAFYLLPTLIALSTGTLSEISSDFLGMDSTAQAMGYWARHAYAYLGHWTIATEPHFNVPIGGIDGGGADGIGPLFRIAVWCSLAVVFFFRKRLKSWGIPLLIAWGSVLMIPTLYIGYARYVPLVYLAVMLPLVLTFPRLTTLLALGICAMSIAWMGWRIVLSTENLSVLSSPTSIVSSDIYNVRCAFRDKLTHDVEQTLTLSGSLTYRYADHESSFPTFPRSMDIDNRLTPAIEKARGMVGHIFHQWSPWVLHHLPELARATFDYRVHLLLSPRGVSDGIQNASP
ncbi:MAG: hypothetical protein RR133_01245 [Kiritimatiellia bacterium]